MLQQPSLSQNESEPYQHHAQSEADNDTPTNIRRSSSNTNNSSTVSKIDRLRHSLPMFRNQVAGHSPLFWHSGTICKPLVEQEYRFYAELESETPAFMQFVPKFYGVMDLERLTEEMANSIQQSSGGNGNEKELNDTIDENSAITTDNNTAPSDANSNSEKALNHNNRLYNKWSMKCQLRKGYASRAQIQYIVLEDLSFAYAKPCILDLKIGTRQHSDSETPAKIASKTARCLHTTSSSLGLRLCGMQVYNPFTNSYTFRDKYYGRSLTTDTFKQSLREFFYDGDTILIEIITAFIQRVERFRRAIVDSTKGRKFYSSSLLLIYEGDRSSRVYDSGNGSSTVEKVSLLRQGSDSSVGSSSSMFSPLSSPHEKRTMSAATSTLSHATSVLNLLESPSNANTNTSTSTSASSSNNLSVVGNGNLSSSLPSSNSFIPGSAANTPASSPPTMSPSSASSSVSLASLNGNARHSSLPASFSTSILSSALSYTTANTSTVTNTSSDEPLIPHHHSSSSLSMMTSASSLSLTSSPYLSSRPIKLYSRKRKTTHAQAMAQARLRGNIDVRIIDFAHTSRLTDGAKAAELDQSLLFGFEHLIGLLKEIRDEELEQRRIEEVDEHHSDDANDSENGDDSDGGDDEKQTSEPEFLTNELEAKECAEKVSKAKNNASGSGSVE